jgi:hypothetical protein
MIALNQSTRLLGERIATPAPQMDWFRGLRAARALCTPLVIGDLRRQHRRLGCLGGFEAILAIA